MGGAAFWLRWSWRDLRRRWVSVGATALVLAIGIGLYTGLGSLESWRKDSNDASFAALRMHDLRVSLPEGGYLRRGGLLGALRRIPSAGDVAAAEERLVAPTQVDASRAGEAILVPGLVVGVDVARGGPHVDGISDEAGRALRPQDAGAPTIVVERGFAEHHDLPPSGRLRVGSGRSLRYVGHGRSPEHFLVSLPDSAGDFGGAEASYAVLFTSLQTAQSLSRRPGTVNELVLKLRPGAKPAAVERQLRRSLADTGATFTTKYEENAFRVLYKDAEGDQKVFGIFATLLLAGAAFAAFNLVSRIVEAQRREIGIGMALGVSDRALALRPLLTGLEIALLGVVGGIGVGLFMSESFKGVLEDLLPLPVHRLDFQPAVFARGAVVGLVLPLLASIYPVWRAVRMKPVDAIRIGFRSAKGSGAAALGRRVRLPGGTFGQMPLRNLLRAPRRTLMTVLGVAAVITVVIALLGMVDSFVETVDRTEQATLGSTPSRTTIDLDRFYPVDSPRVAAIAGNRAVGSAEPRLRVAGRIRSTREQFPLQLELLEADSRLWHPEAVEGELRKSTRGVLLAEEAAHDLGVDKGDFVTIQHPRRTGRASFALADTRIRVVGLHRNPFRTFAYMDISQARLMGLAGLTNTVATTPAPGASPADLKRALFGTPAVAAMQEASASTDLFQERMDDFVGALRVSEAIVLVLALLIAFNSTSINADERAREQATMSAFGVRVRTSLRMAMIESLLAGLLATAIGLGLGLLLLGWVVNYLTPETFPELGVVVSLSRESLASVFVVGVIAVALAPLFLVRRMLRMDIPSTLRVVE